MKNPVRNGPFYPEAARLNGWVGLKEKVDKKFMWLSE